MGLVERADVAAWLQRPVDERTADMAIRVAEGWMRPLVRSTSWPPDAAAHPDLWAAAVELAGIAVDNPTGMVSTAAGGQTDTYSTARRAEILGDVASRYGAVAPVGSFPPPAPWPDGADRPPWSTAW